LISFHRYNNASPNTELVCSLRAEPTVFGGGIALRQTRRPHECPSKPARLRWLTRSYRWKEKSRTNQNANLVRRDEPGSPHERQLKGWNLAGMQIP
jgi:hypothetical protein